MDHPIHPNAEPIPGYRLIERLGRGGYGEVWKAEAPGGMHKAIKFVAGDVDGLGDDGKAAEQEYKSLSRVKTIRHPFILSLERFEVIDGQLTIVMELADRNLWDRYTECVRHGLTGIPRPELLRYMEESAEALDLMNLHHQIQHLDVKPHNIFLVHQHVKVADFGLAKDLEGTRADLTGGVTPTYAPPETFDGWVSRQSDQYSLAIVFMEMLTGHRPFNGTNTRQLILQHLTAAPDLSALPAADRPAVARALSKSPADRFATCADFVRAIRGDERAAPLRNPTPADAPADPPDTDGPPCPTYATPLTLRRSVPALVTPTSKLGPPGGPSRERRRPRVEAPAPAPAGPELERTGDGVLFPALLIGVGHVGLWVLRTLRQLVAERFGAPTLPHLRWLYVDTDPAGAEAAVAGPDAGALAAEDVLIARLRRPGHYLTRDGLPAVNAWLPPEELFRIPRTPATEGSRGLGRLALCDHYHVVRHRLRTALEPFTRSALVDEAHRTTGLGLRSTRPHVYLAASLAGGTGSGMFLDLSYLVRRIARQLGFDRPRVTGVLAVPAAGPSAADRQGLANVRAAITELHHYGCAGTGYRVQFDTREGAFEDPDRPFHRCVMVPVPGRFDPPGSARAVEVAAQSVFADLLTQVGRAAHPDGEDPADRTYVVAGLRRLAWPRAGVVRAAGWLLARRTLQAWAGKPTGEPSAAVAQTVDAVWTDHRFDRSAVHRLLERRAADVLGGSVHDLVEHRLQSSAHGSRSGAASDGHSFRAAFRGLLELLGRPGHDDHEHPHEFGRVLADLVRDTAARADAGLGTAVLSLVDRPGLRVAGAEDAVRLFRRRLTDELARADREAADCEEQALALYVSLHHQFLAPPVGAAAPGPAADGSAAAREWAGVRTRALFARACASVYRILLGNLPDHARELSAIRHQLAALVAQLDVEPPDLPPGGGVVRPVFPNVDGTPAEAAAHLVTALSPDAVREFEDGLQARVRQEFHGVCAVCSRPREAGRAFLNALLDQAGRFVDVRTPHLTVTEVLAAQDRAGDGLRERVAELIGTAAPAPLGSGPPVAPTLTVLGAPADDTATRLAELVRSFSPGGTFQTATTDGDMVLYQEAPVDLAALPLAVADPAGGPLPGESRPVTAHSRTDVAWAPVGPD